MYLICFSYNSQRSMPAISLREIVYFSPLECFFSCGGFLFIYFYFGNNVKGAWSRGGIHGSGIAGPSPSGIGIIGIGRVTIQVGKDSTPCEQSEKGGEKGRRGLF